MQEEKYSETKIAKSSKYAECTYTFCDVAVLNEYQWIPSKNSRYFKTSNFYT